MEPLTKTEVAQVGKVPPHGYVTRAHLKAFDPKGAATYPFPPPPPTLPPPVREKKRKGTPGSPGSPGLNGKPQKVCIFHDPAKGQKCLHGDGCAYRHLDTSKTEGARLHKEATDAFEKAKKNKRAKKGGKGDVDEDSG